MNNAFAKRAVVLVIAVSIAVTAFPQSTHAQLTGPGMPVFDFANATINTVTSGAVTSLSTAYQARKGPAGSGIGLDNIAWLVAKLAIQMMTKSVVNWINSGFSGAPAFVTNLPLFLQQVADVAAGTFIHQLATNGALKSPFQSQVAQAASTQYYQSTSGGGFFSANAYTLSGLLQNDAAFLNGNFSQGGWSGWLQAVLYPQNNPQGAQILAIAGTARQAAAAQGTQSTQLGWGQGFLSWCGNQTGGGGGTGSGGACKTDDDCAGALACLAGKCSADQSLDGSTAQTCTTKDGATGSIQTPGSVIQAQVNKTLGLSGDTLVTADEFNEVIGALLSQLVSQVLGGLGLSGVASVSSGGTGYIDQAATSSQLTGAIASSTDDGTFVNSINSELDGLNQYQTDWQTIFTEAQIATQTLASCPAPNQNANANVANVTNQAGAALAKGAAATTALKQIATDAATSIVSGAPPIEQVTQAFQTFLANPATPSAVDIAFAHAQSTDNSETPHSIPTLFSQMKAIVDGGGCTSK
jgi:hypothetical protein